LTADVTDFVSRNYASLKHLLVTSPAGGKIAEKAKDLGNSKYSHVSDLKASSHAFKLNSVLSGKVQLMHSSSPFTRSFSTSSKDLNKIDTANEVSTINERVKIDISDPQYWPTSIVERNLIEEMVIQKQMTLVQLAEKHSENLELREDTGFKGNNWGIHETHIQHEQEILSRSRLFRVYAVLKVTSNPGAKTPGIDGITLQNAEDKIKMVGKLRDLLNPNKFEAQAIKRVYIPKANGKMRPIGIPTLQDRCLQALINLVLEPLVESNSDTHSYGFRKYRSQKNALGYLRLLIKSGGPDKYILDADIKGFFDNISHEWLLKNIPLPERQKIILKG
jgi:hypothetical protein